MEIPLKDSTALSYLAEFHKELTQDEKDEIFKVLSEEGKAVARAILGQPPQPGDSKDAESVAQVLKQWGQRSSQAR